MGEKKNCTKLQATKNQTEKQLMTYNKIKYLDLVLYHSYYFFIEFGPPLCEEEHCLFITLIKQMGNQFRQQDNDSCLDDRERGVFVFNFL